LAHGSDDAGRVRPVDAAGLVLIRDGSHGPEVLLGRRHRRVAFLPDIYVFPGGRVDPEDARPSGFAERFAPGLEPQLAKSCTRRPPAAFPRAALRETFEETGLLLGRPAAQAPGAGTHVGPWRHFAERGLAPAFDALDLVCRAITPAASRRRYNTRFFLADGGAAQGQLSGDGELEDLRWFPIPETARLGLVDVTQVVLAEALRRWRRRTPAGTPAPLLSYRGDVVCLRRPGHGILIGEAAVLGAAALE
jgi:8-oxo-dGTP pyrophosphatase MutT (NUDIX family)